MKNNLQSLIWRGMKMWNFNESVTEDHNLSTFITFTFPSSESQPLPSRGWSPTASWLHAIVLFRQNIFCSCSQVLEVIESSGFKIAIFLLADVRLIFFTTAAKICRTRWRSRDEDPRLLMSQWLCQVVLVAKKWIFNSQRNFVAVY